MVRKMKYETPFMPDSDETHFETGNDLVEAFGGGADPGALIQTVENIADEEQAIFKGYQQNVPINQKETSVMSLHSKQNMTKQERQAKRRSSLQMMGTLCVSFPFPLLSPLVSSHS